jgi:putative oxidoreductase
LSRFQPVMLSILRIVAAFVFLGHGVQKAFGLFGGLPPTLPANTLLLLKTAGWIETVGGLCLVLGLFTAPVAFILAGEMAVAYFIGHVARLGNMLVPMANGGEPAVLYCFVYLYLATAGGGPLSLDNVLRPSKPVSPPTEDAPQTL